MCTHTSTYTIEGITHTCTHIQGHGQKAACIHAHTDTHRHIDTDRRHHTSVHTHTQTHAHGQMAPYICTHTQTQAQGQARTHGQTTPNIRINTQ